MKISCSKESKKINMLIYIGIAIILYGISNVHVYYAPLLPFGVGLVFALFYINFNGYVLGLVYVVSYVLAGLTFNSFLVALNVVAVLILSQMLKDKKKKTFKKWQIFVLSLVSQIFFILTNVGSGKVNLAILVSIVLSILFLYVSLSFLDAVVHRGFITKLNVDEKICGCVMLVIFIMGMAYTNISIINLGFIFATIIILISNYIFPISTTILLSSIIGISFSINSTNSMFISLFVCLSICAIIFKNTYRIYSCVSYVLGYIIFCLVFGCGISWGEIISIIIGGLAFVLIPKKKLSKLEMIINSNEKIIISDILENAKKKVIGKVEELGAIFDEMKDVYKDMVRGTLPKDSAKEMLKEEVVSYVCKDCINYNNCFRKSGSFANNSFSTIVDIAYEKNKILLVDLPQFFSTNCVKVNSLIDYLNNIIASYKDYEKAVNNLDSSRLIIADQLSGISSVLSTLKNDMNVTLNNNTKISERIIEELAYKNIVCHECFVYYINSNKTEVDLIVTNDTINVKNIELVVTKIFKTKMCIVSSVQSDIHECMYLTLINSPKFDIVYGVSKVNKLSKKLCGDSHSIMKIDNGKFMVSLCDGMGSGDRANKISALTISLIEKFYKAGFENDVILNTINKLLSLNEEENYSTIDLCVFDGSNGYYDFIKLGGCKSFIFRDGGDVEEVESSGLPVGILENIKPHITRKLISPMDIVVIVSDGIFDCFGDNLQSFIVHQDCVNPQSLSDKILNRALELSGNVSKDDMTVICIRAIQLC